MYDDIKQYAKKVENRDLEIDFYSIYKYLYSDKERREYNFYGKNFERDIYIALKKISEKNSDNSATTRELVKEFRRIVDERGEKVPMSDSVLREKIYTLLQRWVKAGLVEKYMADWHLFKAVLYKPLPTLDDYAREKLNHSFGDVFKSATLNAMR